MWYITNMRKGTKGICTKFMNCTAILVLLFKVVSETPSLKDSLNVIQIHFTQPITSFFFVLYCDLLN
jgi:hypothetical protein